MNMNEYQQSAMLTAIYPAENSLTYTVLGLASEAGELAGKWKKAIRDDDGRLTDQRRLEMLAELGDVLWYVAMVADEMGVDLNYIAESNLAKLASRADRGKLTGSGDNR